MGQAHSFGALLRRYRNAAGLTQEELAERAALSVRGLRYLEQDERRPYRDTVRRLAVALALAPPERATLEAVAPYLDDGPSMAVQGNRPSPASTPFVGRARELALLDHHLDVGDSPLLLLAGEPGIGKSRLLAEVAVRAECLGWSVLSGGCQQRGGQEPYAPILGALKRHIARRAPAHPRSDLHGCAWLVRLLPELADGPIEPLPAWTVPPEQERRLMFDAVVRYLSNVARRGCERGALPAGPGSLLLLDDLQWAGPDALALLATLVRSAVDRPLRLVAAYRDTEVRVEDPLSVLLADLAHAELATHHVLAALTPAEAAQLLDGLLTDAGAAAPALRERLLRRAGGVPFSLVSCVRGLRAGAPEEDVAESVPWTLTQSIRQRVAALSETARELLHVAALMGRVAPRAVLSAGSVCPEDEVLAALDAACKAHLLEEEGAESYRFAHDVIREVVEADLSAARRAVLHRRVAEALEQAPGERPVELLAYHYSRSGRQDKAVFYLEQAGDKAWAQAALATAEGYYQELVERLQALGRGQEAARAGEKLGAVLHTAGRFDAALRVLERVAETWRGAGDLESLARVTAKIGWSHAGRGTPGEGIECIQSLLESPGASEPSAGLAELYTGLSWLFFASGRYRESLAAGEQAAALARTVGDDRLLAQAEASRGDALAAIGRVDDALTVIQKALSLAEAMDGVDILYVAQSFISVGYIQYWRGALEASRLTNERGLAVLDRLGDRPWRAFLLANHALVALVAGEWHHARAELEQAVALMSQQDESYLSPYPLYGLGQLCAVEGNWGDASAYLDEALTIAARRGGDWQVLRQASGLLAELDILAGRPDAARDRLIPLLDRPGMEELEVTVRVLPRLAWAHLELGQTAQAAEVVARAIQRARDADLRLALADALWVQAMVAIRQGQWDEAERTLEEGLTLARCLPYPYAEGRLLHVYGLLRAQQDEPVAARERLEAALAIFRRLGARKDAERTEQAIALGS